MLDLVDWLRNLPENAITVATAILGASVALLLAAVTEWIVGRRARTDLLTRKLEELYLLIIQWMDDAAATKVAVDELVKCQPLSADQRSTLLERYSKPRADRRISMHIELYFPQLERFNQEVFEANRAFARVIRLMAQGKETTAPEIQRTWLRLSVALNPLRREIIENKTYLTRRNLLRGRYRKWARNGGDA